MACNTSVTQLVLGDGLGWGVGIYVCTCRIGARILYAPSGSTEATAFGGTSSDVAVKENMVTLNRVESGGSIMPNEGLWILKWEIERSAREKAVREKRCVGLCCERMQRRACFDCRSCRPQEGGPEELS